MALLSGGILAPIIGGGSGNNDGLLGSVVNGGLLDPILGGGGTGGLLDPILGGGGTGGLLDPILGGDGNGGLLEPILGGVGGGTVSDLLDGLLGDNLLEGALDLIEDILGGFGDSPSGDDLVSQLVSPLLDALADVRVVAGGETLLDTAPQSDSTLTLDLNLLNPNGGLLGVDGTLLGLDLDGVLGGNTLLDLDITPSDPGDGGPPGPGGPTTPDDPEAYDLQLVGTNLRDTFVIGDKSAFVAGQGDIDTVIYAQNASEFTYAFGSNAIILTDSTNSDYLSSVERIKFFDGTILLDTGLGENAGFAYRLYSAALNRTPDDAGLEFWINRVDRGDSRGEIAAGFVNSAEFKQAYGTNLNNAAFVDILYRNILDRAPEAAGLAFWVDQLDRGAARGSVLAGLSESAENFQATQQTVGDFIFIS